jgi:hypothetical protein
VAAGAGVDVSTADLVIELVMIIGAAAVVVGSKIVVSPVIGAVIAAGSCPAQSPTSQPWPSAARASGADGNAGIDNAGSDAVAVNIQICAADASIYDGNTDGGLVTHIGSMTAASSRPSRPAGWGMEPRSHCSTDGRPPRPANPAYIRRAVPVPEM